MQEKDWKKKTHSWTPKETDGLPFSDLPMDQERTFTGLPVDDIDANRIALIGPSGSGKTSFIGKNKSLLFESTSDASITVVIKK